MYIDRSIRLDMLDTVGKRLSWARGIAGITGSELAKLSGVSRSYPSSIERGRSGEHMPIQYADRIAAVFGSSAEWLALGRGEAPTEQAIKRAVSRARKKAGSRAA